MSFVHLLAQAAVAATPEAVAQQGVISYGPEFFSAYQPANAEEMLLRVPGFAIDSGDDVRGYEGSAGNVLIDGERPATKSEDLESVLRRLPASRIERIDLIRGGAPGIDMQGKAVIANIVRKPGGGVQGVAAYAQRHTWDGRTVPALRLEGSGDLGAARWELGLLGGGYVDDGDGDGDGVRISRTGQVTPLDIEAEGDGINGQATGVFETPTLGGALRLNGRIFSEKHKEEENIRVVSATPFFEHNVDRIRTDDTEIGGTFTRPFGARTTLELVGLRQSRDQAIDVNFTNGTTSDFALRRDSGEVIGRAVLKYRATDRMSLEAGGEFAVNKLDSHTRVATDGVPQVLPAANVEVQEDRAEVFAKAVWRPTDQWTLDGSLRYETSDISSDGDVLLTKTLRYLKPRIAVTWAPLASTQFRLRGEREVGQLDFDDFVADANFSDSSGVSAGNPDLDPEQAWVGEAAVEHRFWGAGSATITFRHYELSDVIDRGPVTGPGGLIFDRPENIGDGTKDELALQLSMPLSALGVRGATLRGEVTKRWSEVIDPTTGEKREISNLHPIDWEVRYTHDLPQWNMTFGLDVFGGWRETSYRFNQVRTIKLRPFVRPYVEYRPRSDLNFRFEIANATARGLRSTVETYPGLRSAGGVAFVDDRDYQPGQMFYFRIRKTFGG